MQLKLDEKKIRKGRSIGLPYVGMNFLKNIPLKEFMYFLIG